MNWPVILTAAGLVGLVSATSCAAPGGQPPAEVRLVKMTCQAVLHVGSAPELDACMRSLSSSLAAKLEADIAQRADTACAAQGIARDTSAYSMCVLEHENAYAAAVAQANGHDGPSADPVKLADDPKRGPGLNLRSPKLPGANTVALVPDGDLGRQLPLRRQRR